MSVTHSNQRSLQNCRRFDISHIGHLCIFHHLYELSTTALPTRHADHRESIPPPQPSLPTFPAPPFPGWLLLLFSPLLPSLLPLPRTHSPAASSPPYAAISSSITLALPRPARQTSLPALPLALHGYPLRGPGLVGDSASPPGLHRLIDL